MEERKKIKNREDNLKQKYYENSKFFLRNTI